MRMLVLVIPPASCSFFVFYIPNLELDAPIFEVADYGLVADVYEAVPEMVRKLQEYQAN